MSTETIHFSGNEKQVVQSRADAILEYPEERFTRQDLSPQLRRCFRDLLRNNIIHPVGQEQIVVTADESPSNTPTRYWVEQYTVVEHAREIAKQVASNRDPVLPCGHSGVKHHNGQYRCGCRVCDAAFAVSEIEVEQ